MQEDILTKRMMLIDKYPWLWHVMLFYFWHFNICEQIFVYMCKGPGSIRLIFGLNISENLKLFNVLEV